MNEGVEHLYHIYLSDDQFVKAVYRHLEIIDLKLLGAWHPLSDTAPVSNLLLVSNPLIHNPQIVIPILQWHSKAGRLRHSSLFAVSPPIQLPPMSEEATKPQTNFTQQPASSWESSSLCSLMTIQFFGQP